MMPRLFVIFFWREEGYLCQAKEFESGVHWIDLPQKPFPGLGKMWLVV